MNKRVLFLRSGKLQLLRVDKQDTCVERFWELTENKVPYSVALHLSENKQCVYSLVIERSQAPVSAPSDKAFSK